MAGGMDLGNGGGGKKKALDAALNLVPFIDLMAVTIVFLIMSAVWTQLGRLTVASSNSGGEGTPPPSVPVALSLKDKSFELTVGGSSVGSIDVTRDANGRLQLEALTKKLAAVKAQLPDQPAITVRAVDGLAYDDLVRVIDACIGNEFPSISVEPLG
ncbi:MAG: ExbD/TolR family protein [Archangium sp.]